MPLYIKFLPRNALNQYYKKKMNLLVYKKYLIKKYESIWNENSSLIKKEFNRKPVYKTKYIKTKANLSV